MPSPAARNAGSPISRPSSARSKLTALISAPAPKASTAPTRRSGHLRAIPKIAPRISDDAASAPQPTASKNIGEIVQDVRVVVAGDAVDAHGGAAATEVDDRPLAVIAYGDRLHGGAARRRAVAGDVVVEVPAPQAARTVISMHGAGRVERDVQPAVAAAERAVTAPGA